MQLGMLLRELSRQRRYVVLSVLLAAIVAFASIYKVSLAPPNIRPRALAIGAASTSVVIDGATSEIANVQANSNELTVLTTHTDLLGDVMTSVVVRADIARQLGIQPEQLEVDAPITADVPRDQIEPGSGETATTLLASGDHYILQVQADPAIPVLYIFAQAPSAAAAVHLANVSVESLRSYVDSLAVSDHTPPAQQIRLDQLGPARGGIVNGGVAVEVAVLAFFTVLFLSLGAALSVSRVRRGWTAAKLAEPAPRP